MHMGTITATITITIIEVRFQTLPTDFGPRALLAFRSRPFPANSSR